MVTPEYLYKINFRKIIYVIVGETGNIQHIIFECNENKRNCDVLYNHLTHL